MSSAKVCRASLPMFFWVGRKKCLGVALLMEKADGKRKRCCEATQHFYSCGRVSCGLVGSSSFERGWIGVDFCETCCGWFTAREDEARARDEPHPYAIPKSVSTCIPLCTRNPT